MEIFINIFALSYIVLSISGSENSIILSVLSLFICFMILIENKLKLHKQDFMYPPLKFMCLFLFFVLLELVISGAGIIKYILSRFSLFFPIILFVYYSRRKSNKKILKFMLLVWILITIWACYLFSTGMLSARAMAAHMQENVIFSGGGYGFAVGSAILLVYIFEMIIWKRIKINFINTAYMCLLFYLVILTQSTITILSMIIGLVSAIILRIFNVSKISKFTKKQFLGIIISISCCSLFLLFKERIGSAIIEISKKINGIVSQRLLEVGQMLKYGSTSLENSSDMLGRIDLLLESIKTFFEYPIFGVVSRYGSNFYVLSKLGVGSHGELFDALAQYGLFAGIPYVLIFFTNFIVERRNQVKSIGFGYIIVYIFLFIFNPFLYAQVNVCIFLIIPLITKLYNK